MGRIDIDGTAVRKRRLSLKGAPSQIELARKIGISRVTLSEIERGKSGASYQMAERLARALACGVADLVKSPRPHEGWNAGSGSAGGARPVPVHGGISPKGIVYAPHEPPKGYTDFVVEHPRSGALHALAVTTDEFGPRLPKGGFVLLRARNDGTPPEGRLVLLTLKGRLCLGRLARKDARLEFREERPAARPVRVDKKDARTATAVHKIILVLEP